MNEPEEETEEPETDWKDDYDYRNSVEKDLL